MAGPECESVSVSLCAPVRFGRAEPHKARSKESCLRGVHRSRNAGFVHFTQAFTGRDFEVVRMLKSIHRRFNGHRSSRNSSRTDGREGSASAQSFFWCLRGLCQCDRSSVSCPSSSLACNLVARNPEAQEDVVSIGSKRHCTQVLRADVSTGLLKRTVANTDFPQAGKEGAAERRWLHHFAARKQVAYNRTEVCDKT